MIVRGTPRWTGRLLDMAINAFALAAVLILALLVAGIGFEVVMRYAFGLPTRWVNEFSEYALLWLAFLAGPWVLREHAHVKVELLTDALSAQWQHRLHVTTSVIGAAVCALFFWVSTGYVIEIRKSGELLFKSVVVEKWTIMAVMPPSLALLALQFARAAWQPSRASSAAVL
jgi:TRAP-type C4-dicarboxylate transport system permease small subunit